MQYFKMHSRKTAVCATDVPKTGPAQLMTEKERERVELGTIMHMLMSFLCRFASGNEDKH